MKRRNAETGKMRRPLKRTKITEGMYGNSMLYLKFVMLWATVVMADYMLEFRFEFLWPFWMMLRSVYDSYKYQGLAFSVFFICIALTSDMICFFFIPLQYIFFAASTYVWVQYVWYTFADKGICLPTVAICCLVVYVEGALRGERSSSLELYRPLAAHCVGYPAVTLGFSVKSYVGHRLRLRRQRQVRAENEFYFQLMRDALPESALEQAPPAPREDRPTEEADSRHMNGSVKKRCREQNGDAHVKFEKLEKHVSQSRERSSLSATPHALSNGGAHTHDDDERHDHGKGGAKNSKCEKKEASTLKEEKRRSKNKDKDKDNSCDSHKSTEQTKEQIVKEVESTKESVKSKECNGYKEEKRERDKDKETREREKEREREQREIREAREWSEELKRVKAELAAAVRGEAEARRALAAAAAAERQRRADHNHLKQAYATLQHKMSLWRGGERALERRLGEERRARTAAEHQLLRHTRHSGECESEWCRSRRAALESEASALRRELTRARDSQQQMQRELSQAENQVRSLESRASPPPGSSAPRAWQALQERALHLETSLSAETRVKLDLLAALGDAKRQIHIQEGLISSKEKELSELKAQLLAVLPAELLPAASPLDPNASAYTPKQLCSDA